MSRQQLVTPETGDYAPGELRAIAASLIGQDSGAICQVVCVVTWHGGQDCHELTVLNDEHRGTAETAELLGHASEHLTRPCRRCRRASRKWRRGHHARGM